MSTEQGIDASQCANENEAYIDASLNISTGQIIGASVYQKMELI
jgi:hypothetical protein